MKKNLSRWEKFLCAIMIHDWIYSARPDFKDASDEFREGEHFNRRCVRCGRDEHLLQYDHHK